MFESRTFENLIKDALEKVPDEVDKREGTIIYDAIAPICAELAQAYIDLENALKEGFADTASKIYLIKRAKERGVIPYKATNSIVLANIDGDVDLKYGARFNVMGLNFFYIGEKENEYYKLQCETSGIAGNISNAELTALDNITGFKRGRIISLFSSARNEEDTESLRRRYFESFESQAFGGNRSDYIEKLNNLNEDIEVSKNGGIGGIKVYRAKQAGGSIQIWITNNSYIAPTTQLIDIVQEKIDPLDKSGEGYGIAPIGHKVIIEPVKEVIIDISTTITLKAGYGLADVLGYLETAIEVYLQEIRGNWGEESLVIRIAQVESCMLNVNGVLDVQNTAINGNSQNLTLDEYSIPIKGVLNVTS